MERTVLRAAPGMVLTDGRIYGRQIFLAAGMDAFVFYEITEAEYNTIMEEEMPDEV